MQHRNEMLDLAAHPHLDRDLLERRFLAVAERGTAHHEAAFAGIELVHLVLQALDQGRRREVEVGFGQEPGVAGLEGTHFREPLLHRLLLLRGGAVARFLVAQLDQLVARIEQRRHEPPMHEQQVAEANRDQQQRHGEQAAAPSVGQQLHRCPPPRLRSGHNPR
jgi:hypothetical protein